MRDRPAPLTLRSDPAADSLQSRDLASRSVHVRAATLDQPTRSVEVTMTSEQPVTVMDYARYEPIDEVLVGDGGQFPDQLPLLANHSRYSLDSVLGSVRQIRRDGGGWVGRAYFAEGDPAADSAWNKVRQGHLTDVSVGYRATQYTDIPAGGRATVAGREYAAGQARPLRVSTQWETKELSLVPIGADRTTKVRNEPGEPGGKVRSMNKQLRQYLESVGLRHDATEDQAVAFLAAMGGEQKVRADAIAAGTMTLEQATRATGPAGAPPPQPGQRSDPVVTTAVTSTPPAAPADPNALREEAVRAERARVTAVRGLAVDGVPPELVTRAEAEGWDETRAGREFLTALRGGRQPSVGADAGGNGSAPGGIVRSHERDCTRDALGVALFMRSGHDDQAALKPVVDRLNVQRARNGQAPLVLDNVCQQARRYDDMSLLDVCREALRLDGRQVPHSREETIRSAVSGGSLTQIFTTSVNAMLLMAYEEEPDTTDWCEEKEVADFKINTAIRFSTNAGLKKLGRGGSAEHANTEDTAETYKVARYAKQFSIDDQDIIDDSMGAFSDVPQEFGKAAARLRPDLVYAMVLANPTMADTGQVFNSTALTTAGGHANYAADAATALGGPLAAGTLQLAITKMRQQYRGSGRNKVPLNIVPETLLVPPELQFTAEILLQSAERIISTSDGGTFNPLKGRLKAVTETRLGTVGVTDPDSGTAYTGTAVNYWLMARPGLHARVAYRRGTNGQPMLRSFVLDKGQWGIGWDVALDVGVKFVDFRGGFFAKGST